jgi:hypothetical protein
MEAKLKDDPSKDKGIGVGETGGEPAMEDEEDDTSVYVDSEDWVLRESARAPPTSMPVKNDSSIFSLSVTVL